jgi:hypothetical protein
MIEPVSTPPPAPQWSSETRTWVSMLLFVHLFAVVIAVTTYTRPSLLQERIHTLFQPYLRNLHLSPFPVTYPFARFHLTHGNESDIDFSIEVDVPETDGSNRTVTIPPQTLQPLVRYRRYQALANAAGTLAVGEVPSDASGVLPKAIAGSVLRRAGATGGLVRIKGFALAELDSSAAITPYASAEPPVIRDIYDAQVIVTPTSIELLRKAATLEVAPVEGARRSGASGPTAPAKAKPAADAKPAVDAKPPGTSQPLPTLNPALPAPPSGATP